MPFKGWFPFRPSKTRSKQACGVLQSRPYNKYVQYRPWGLILQSKFKITQKGQKRWQKRCKTLDAILSKFFKILLVKKIYFGFTCSNKGFHLWCNNYFKLWFILTDYQIRHFVNVFTQLALVSCDHLANKWACFTLKNCFKNLFQWCTYSANLLCMMFLYKQICSRLFKKLSTIL